MYTKLKFFFTSFIIQFFLNIGIDEDNKQVLEMIYSDVFRYYGEGDYIHLKQGIFEHPGLKFFFFFRLASKRPKNVIRRQCHNFSIYFFRRYFYNYAFQIPLSTNIGKGFQILHFGNIVINPSCSIGKNCTINPGVLIGQSNRGVPIIGNQVWIGANAVLVGDIIVGDNVVIAPGAYVNVNVPNNSLVMGNPCIIHAKTSSIINGYIVNQIL